MFAFFKRKPTAREAVEFCQKIGNQTLIEPVLEDGRYKGFLVRLRQTGAELAPHFQFEEARTFFVDIIDVRIADGDFEPISPDREAVGLPPLAEDGRASAARAILARDNVPFISWNVQDN
jgi:hypothetical protein